MQSSEAKRKKNHPSRTESGASFRGKLLRALCLSVGIGAVLILCVSLILSLTPDPGKYIRPAALICAGITFFCAGLISGKKVPESAVSAGAVNGLLLSALTLLLSVLFHRSGSGYPAWAVVLLHTATILLSLLGAWLSARKPKGGAKKRRTYAKSRS